VNLTLIRILRGYPPLSKKLPIELAVKNCIIL
jgi:hypothetical protein